MQQAIEEIGEVIDCEEPVSASELVGMLREVEEIFPDRSQTVH